MADHLNLALYRFRLNLMLPPISGDAMAQRQATDATDWPEARL